MKMRKRRKVAALVAYKRRSAPILKAQRSEVRGRVASSLGVLKISGIAIDVLGKALAEKLMFYMAKVTRRVFNVIA